MSELIYRLADAAGLRKAEFDCAACSVHHRKEWLECEIWLWPGIYAVFHDGRFSMRFDRDQKPWWKTNSAELRESLRSLNEVIAMKYKGCLKDLEVKSFGRVTIRFRAGWSLVLHDGRIMDTAAHDLLLSAVDGGWKRTRDPHDGWHAFLPCNFLDHDLRSSLARVVLLGEPFSAISREDAFEALLERLTADMMEVSVDGLFFEDQFYGDIRDMPFSETET